MTKAKLGRPTKYDPKTMIPKMLKEAAEGAGRLEVCAVLGISAETMLQWERDKPEFLEATNRARQLSQAWWEKQGRQGIWSREFNAPAYSLQVRNRFPKDWRDKHEVTGADGGPLKFVIERDE